MLDIQLIRRDPDAVRRALARRGPGPAAAIDRVLELDERWRALTAELETLRAEQNAASKGRKGPPTPEERERLAELAAQGRELSDSETAVRAELDAELAALPALPSPEAPDEDEVVREVGEAGATGRDHLELAGPRIDMEAAARTSGSRFAYLKGDLVMLELALVHFALERLRAQGFEPVIPPVLVREQALYGTACFRTPNSRSTAWPTTTCTWPAPRGPVGLAARGRDHRRRCAPDSLRGLFAVLPPRGRGGGQGHARDLPVHQFDKVEMFCFVRPRRATPSTSACSRSRSRSSGARFPTASSRRGRTTSGRRRQEVRLRGLDAGSGALPRAHLDLEHDRLPGPAARDALPPARAGATRVHAQRHGCHRRRTLIAIIENSSRRTARSPARGARSLRRPLQTLPPA